jgi:hypothetical protein
LVFVLHCFLPPLPACTEWVSHRGMKSTWGPGSIMIAASVARTQATAAPAIAMWNLENS